MQTLKRFAKSENGATAIEYGLISALVAVAVVGGMNSLGDSMLAMYDLITSTVVAAL